MVFTPIRLPALVLLGAFAIPSGVDAQKRALDHDDILTWRTIQAPSLSPDGAWLTYALSPVEGDPVVIVRQALEDGVSLEFRGERPAFTSDSRYVVVSIPPVEATVDSLRREGVRNSELPGDSLAVVELAEISGMGLEAVRRLGAVESYRTAGYGPWLAYRPAEEEGEGEDDPDDEEKGEEEPAEQEGEAEDEENDKTKEAGDALVLVDLVSGSETRFELVDEFVFADEGGVFAYATSSEDGSEDGVYVLELGGSSDAGAVFQGASHYRELTLSENGDRLAFLADRDDYQADQPEFVLYQSSAPEWDEATAVASSGSGSIPAGWWVSEHGFLSYSDDGERLYFGTAPRPEPEVEDDTPDDDKVEIDIWSWKDPYLQPMQLVQANRERDRTYRAVAHLATGSLVQLATKEVPDVAMADAEGAGFALGLSSLPYRQMVSWDGTYRDFYVVDMATGDRRKVAEMVKSFASISPEGRYLTWWDGVERHWVVAPTDGGGPLFASAGVPHPVWNELDDHPDLPPSYGSAGWTEGDEAFLFYDDFDIWRFEPASGETTNLTAGMGRAEGIRFRYSRTDFDQLAIEEGEALLSAFHKTDKRSGFYRGRTDRAAAPSEVVMAEKRLQLRGKAEDAERWLLTRQDFREYPDLWVTDGSLTDAFKVSEANPQQEEFTWGDAELVEWRSNDGTPLQGILVKPDDFDPSDNYPMMVYFYERMSDGLYSYRSPTPGGSSVAISFYVSRGYLAFIPDIPYEVGYPGESALDAVVPGVLSLVDRGFVDQARIGVQGHSWGGYQIAYMITKTDLFAAAEAGAPVSNMTSAYGGIRWSSGMSRMFQYERTQSRIGGTLWEETQTYLHNSPVFFADKVRTPLLMMHNDEDGAVPWYQGIEMFVALRRLGKPVWMLNYNGEGHGLSRLPNRKDWALRMQQFFDHYLMDAPAPVWMEEGVPAILKGVTLGTELTSRSGIS